MNSLPRLAALFLLSTGWALSAADTISFPSDVADTLRDSALAPPLLQLEFHPAATGGRLGKDSPRLSGTPVGPYECRARIPSPDNKPGVYPLRISIRTKSVFRDEAGNEVKPGKKAVAKSEHATQFTMSLLTGTGADTGDKASQPIRLTDLLSSNENDILSKECFFLDDKVLRPGLSGKDVEALLGTAVIKRTEPKTVEATGQIIETWTIESHDLQLNFSVKPDSTRSLESLRAGSSAKLESSCGIQPGHPESRVLLAYRDQINQQDSTPGELLVIGNLYSGLFISIKDGKVDSLYLGQGAE